MRWQRLLVRSAQQGGLGRRCALTFRGEGGCSLCLAFAGAAMKITSSYLRCRRNEVALGSARPEVSCACDEAIYVNWLFTNRFQSLVKRRGSVVAACGSVCASGEGVLANKVKACLPLHVFAAVAWLSENV